MGMLTSQSSSTPVGGWQINSCIGDKQSALSSAQGWTHPPQQGDLAQSFKLYEAPVPLNVRSTPDSGA